MNRCVVCNERPRSLDLRITKQRKYKNICDDLKCRNTYYHASVNMRAKWSK